MASSNVPTCESVPVGVDDLTDSPAFTRRLELLKHLSAAQQDKIEVLIEHVSREIGDDAQGDMMLEVLFECLRGKKDETMNLFREARESRAAAEEKQKRQKEQFEAAKKAASEWKKKIAAQKADKESLEKEKAKTAKPAEPMPAPGTFRTTMALLQRFLTALKLYAHQYCLLLRP
jgi:hypothetical protein